MRIPTGIRIDLAVCVGLLAFTSALAQRAAPAAGPDPYASMSDAELDALHEARRQGTAPPASFDRSLLPLITDRINVVRSSVWGRDHGTVPPSASQAQDLVDELFVDWNDWEANSLWQDTILDEIKKASRHPALSLEARVVIRNGLLEYLEGGGGRESPYHMADLGEALACTVAYDDWATQETARQLIEGAQEWAGSVGKTRFAQRLRSRRESLFGPSDTEGIELADDPLRGDLPGIPERYRRARELLYGLMRTSLPTVDQIERLFDAVRAHFSDEPLAADVLARLLVTYEQILKRRGVPSDVVKTVDRHLVRLVHEDDLLHGARLWFLWGRAASALETRASKDMRRLVDRGLSGDLDTAQRDAFEMVAKILFQAPPAPTQAAPSLTDHAADRATSMPAPPSP